MWAERVGAGRDGCDEVRDQEGQPERGGEEEDDDGDAGEGGEVSGGEGATALFRVLAVGFEIEQVVDDVGGRGAEAEA